MDGGQELLLSILDAKLKMINEFNKDDIMCNGINLVDLVKSIEKNDDNFANVTNAVIDYVIENISVKNPENFKSNTIKVRDLLIGKKDYNLKVELNTEYKNIINTFVKYLNRILGNILPGVVDISELEKSVNRLKQNILNREIINDFDLIEDLLLEYDKNNYDSNIISVMKFINIHNIGILKTVKKNAPLFDINFIRRPKLDPQVIDILNKLDIDYKELPNYLISELKRCDVEVVTNTYNIIRQNKAEDGGILHLISKDNYLAILTILLYANETSIKSVINSVKDSKKAVDINILKILLNNIMTCFLAKNNEFFKPKYEDFIKNMVILRELNINYKSLINKTPLFMITDNKVLEYTLKYLERYGANRKLVINKCYKILAVNPSLLIDNIEVLKNHNINFKSYFGESNKNYSLLKITNLEEKISYILEHTNKVKTDPLDYELLNKYIVSKIVKETTDEVRHD